MRLLHCWMAVPLDAPLATIPSRCRLPSDTRCWHSLFRSGNGIKLRHAKMRSVSCRFSPTREWCLCAFLHSLGQSSMLFILVSSFSGPTRTRSTSSRNSSMSKWRLAPSSFGQSSRSLSRKTQTICGKLEGLFRRTRTKSTSCKKHGNRFGARYADDVGSRIR